jgi:hypothetical protein
MTSDPVRLLEDPSATSALRSDLVHAVEAQVQGLDLAAGLAALQKATASVTSSTTVVAGTSLFTKLAIGAGVAVGVVALWLGLGDDPQADDGERVAPPAVVSAAELEAEDPRGGPRARALGERGEAPRAAAPVEVMLAKAEPAKAGAGEPEPKAQPEVQPVEPEVTGREAGDPKPTSSARRTRATADRPPGEKAGDPSPGPSADGDSVLREAKLVAKARSNLARDPARALALAEEAERDFPRGQLVEERRAIAIRALIALGRLDEAQRRAEPFLAEYGRGAHAAAVRRALEDAGEAP